MVATGDIKRGKMGNSRNWRFVAGKIMELNGEDSSQALAMFDDRTVDGHINRYL